MCYESISEACMDNLNGWNIKIPCYNLFNKHKDSEKVHMGLYKVF